MVQKVLGHSHLPCFPAAAKHAGRLLGQRLSAVFTPNAPQLLFLFAANKLEEVYTQIFNVLKPGGLFLSYEWVSTKDFDPSNPEHVKVIDEINFGNGLPEMRTWKQAEDAGKAVGFKLVTRWVQRGFLIASTGMKPQDATDFCIHTEIVYADVLVQSTWLLHCLGHISGYPCTTLISCTYHGAVADSPCLAPAPYPLQS